MSGRLDTDPLFVGLTRPTLLFGVSMKFSALNLMVAVVLMVNGGGIKVVIVALVLHLIGYILSFRDARFIEVFLVRNQKCTAVSNQGFFGGNTYIA